VHGLIVDVHERFEDVHGRCVEGYEPLVVRSRRRSSRALVGLVHEHWTYRSRPRVHASRRH
jgi:hypothetical protein